MKYKYHEYSYPPFLSWGIFGWIWKRLCCRKGWHLWDEVLSNGADTEDGWDSYMVCDVCEEDIQLVLEPEND